MTTELNVKLALEDVWVVDGIIRVVVKDTAQMKAILTETSFKKISFSQ